MPQNDIPGLAQKEFLIMNLLVGSPRPMYGLQLVELSDGGLKRGTIYVTLNRLEEKRYVSSRREDAQPGIAMPRRLYKATGLGEKVFNALAAAGGRAWLKEALA